MQRVLMERYSLNWDEVYNLGIIRRLILLGANYRVKPAKPKPKDKPLDPEEVKRIMGW